MKKYISLLIGLTTLAHSLNVAAEELVFTKALQVKNQKPAPKPENNSLDTPSPKIVTTQAVDGNVQNSNFLYLKHNDLRAIVKNGEPIIQSIAKDVLMNIKENPTLFSGIKGLTYYMDKDDFDNPHDHDHGLTALGPKGEISTKNGKEYYKITTNEERTERRKNLIFSASFERILKTGNIYDMDLLLFIHSDSTGHIFRYINVSMDITSLHKHLMKNISKKKGVPKIGVANLIFKKALKEIHLDETNFQIHVEIATQKAILVDSNYGIKKVIPVTVGAIDSRSASNNPDAIDSLTLLVPGRQIVYKDFNLADTVLVKRKVWTAYNNNAQKISPAGYKGRPFISLIDRSRMNKNLDGSFKTYKTRLNNNGNNVFVLDSNHQPIPDPNGTPYYPHGYRLIGFHYQIDDTGLERGFKSHGCIRLQDHDLYTIDAIVNSGPQDLVSVEVKMLLDKYQDIDSLYERSQSYNKVIYSTAPEPDNFTVYCKNKGSYPVRSFMGRNGQRYHTLSNIDCLTRISQVNDSVQELSKVLTQESGSNISTLQRNIEHFHLKLRKKTLEQNLNYIEFLRADVLSKNNIDASTYVLNLLQNYESMPRSKQFKQMTLIDEITSCSENPQCQKEVLSFKTSKIDKPTNTNSDQWPSIKLLVNYDTVRQELRKYKHQCNHLKILKSRNKKNIINYCQRLLAWFLDNGYGQISQ